MLTKRGFAGVWVCAGFGIVTFVYVLGASFYLSSKIDRVKSEGVLAQAQATREQTQAIKEQTKSQVALANAILKFVKVARP